MYTCVWQVNALAHYLLTAELMPLLLKSPAARVVSQSSGARKLWKPLDVPARMRQDLSAATIMPGKYDAFSQYCLSKAANVFFTFGLNQQLQKAGAKQVIAVATDPGFACTGVNIQHNLVRIHRRSIIEPIQLSVCLLRFSKEVCIM